MSDTRKMTNEEIMLLVREAGFSLGGDVASISWFLDRYKKADETKRPQIFSQDSGTYLGVVEGVLASLERAVEIIIKFKAEHPEIDDKDLDDLLSANLQMKESFIRLKVLLVDESSLNGEIEQLSKQYKDLLVDITHSHEKGLWKRYKEACVIIARETGQKIEYVDNARTSARHYKSSGRK